MSGAFNLGLLRERERNVAEALRWHVVTAEARLVRAMGRAGDLSDRTRDHGPALRWWRRSAEQGDAKPRRTARRGGAAGGRHAQARTWFEQTAAAGGDQAAGQSA